MKKKKVLKAAIAPREAIIRYTRDIAAGRRRMADDPDIWFTSLESFAKVLSDKNPRLAGAYCRTGASVNRCARGGKRARQEQPFAYSADHGAVWLGHAQKGRGPQAAAGGDLQPA